MFPLRHARYKWRGNILDWLLEIWTVISCWISWLKFGRLVQSPFADRYVSITTILRGGSGRSIICCWCLAFARETLNEELFVLRGATTYTHLLNRNRKNCSDIFSFLSLIFCNDRESWWAKLAKLHATAPARAAQWHLSEKDHCEHHGNAITCTGVLLLQLHTGCVLQLVCTKQTNSSLIQ
jgi:hypothetical protein